MQKKNRSELIRAALMKLSADDRDILDLVYFHENSVEDCALILNLPVATVKTRMLSARKKLAELVEEAQSRQHRRNGSPAGGHAAVGATCAYFRGRARWEALLTQTSDVSALRGRAGDRRWVPIAVALVQGHALLLGRCRCGGCAGQDRSNRQHDR